MFPLSVLKGTAQTPVGQEIASFGLGMDGSGAFQEFALPEFLAVFPTDLAPVVGQQVTIGPANFNHTDVNARITLFEQRATAPFTSLTLGGDVTECDLIAKTVEGGIERGYLRQANGTFLPDDAGPEISEAALRAKADPVGAGQHITYTCVPPGSGVRMEIDRDEDTLGDGVETDTGTFNGPTDAGTSPTLRDTDGDGFADGEEVAAGSDPTNSASFPSAEVSALSRPLAGLLAALLVLAGRRFTNVLRGSS
jgi:hypothetical protein